MRKKLIQKISKSLVLIIMKIQKINKRNLKKKKRKSKKTDRSKELNCNQLKLIKSTKKNF